MENTRPGPAALSAERLWAMARHTVMYGLSPVLARAIGFLMLPLYTRVLSPSDYGTLEIVLLAANFLNIFLGLEFVEGLLRLYHSYPAEHDKDEIVSTAILFTSVLTVAAVLVADPFRHQISVLLFGDDTHAHLLRLALWSLVATNVFGVVAGFFQAKTMSATFTTLAIIQFISTLSLTVLFVTVFAWGVEGILLSQLIVTGILAIGTAAWVLCRLGFGFSRRKARQLLVFGAPLVGMSLGWFVLNAADRIVLSQVGSLADVGVYSLANRLATVLLVLVVTPFSLLWAAERFKLANAPQGQEAIARVFTYFFACLCFAALGLSVWMHDVIRIMATERFWPAAELAPVLVLAYCLWAVFGYLTTGLLIENKTIYVGLLATGAAVLDILCSIVLGRAFLAHGVAWARVITLGVLISSIYIVAQAVYPIRWEFRRIATVAGVTIGLFLVSTYFPEGAPLLGIITKAPLLVAFPAVLVCFGFLTAREKGWLRARTKAMTDRLQAMARV
jgi:O-antigen/teichoic acid export membrane protein